jgi:hypothetical protein
MARDGELRMRFRYGEITVECVMPDVELVTVTIWGSNFESREAVCDGLVAACRKQYDNRGVGMPVFSTLTAGLVLGPNTHEITVRNGDCLGGLGPVWNTLLTISDEAKARAFRERKAGAE